jgi:hypothetical protein
MESEPKQYIKVVTNTHKSDIKGPEDYLITITPALNGSMLLENISALQQIAISLGKVWLPIGATVSGITPARQCCIDLLYDYFKVDYIRALWLDSDVKILESEPVVEAFRYADQNNINIVADYLRSPWPNPDHTIYHRQKFQKDDGSIVEKFDVMYTTTEIESMPNYSKVDFAGLGFCYGWVPLKYEFHRSRMGEDFWYYIDNKLEIRLAKQIKLAHKKSQWLVNK